MTLIDPAPSAVDAEEASDPPTAGNPAAGDADTPRRRRALGRDDRIELVTAAGAGAAGAVATALLFEWTHPLGLVVWGTLVGGVALFALVQNRLGTIAAVDRIVTFAVYVAAVITVGVLGWMVIDVMRQGLPGIDLEFLTSDMSMSGPLDPGGGAFHAILGTLQQTLIAAVVAVPLGILTAVYLHEIKGRASGIVRFVADAMSGLPSIVAGLLVYTLWCIRFGFSGVAASMALIVVMLPIVVRTSEEILRTVPGSLREAALALGSPQWKVVMRVVLPTARSGLVTASILGVARVIGETAPVLLTAFGSASTNWNPFSGQQSNLPLFVWSMIRQPNEVQLERAWAGALSLIVLVLVLFITARWISGRGDRLRKGTR